MKKLNKDSIENLLRGSSLLSCGGGLSYQEQSTLISNSGISAFRLLDPEELSADSRSITVAELGPSDAPPLDHSKVKELINFFEQETGEKITHILPGEIGQEAVTLSASTHLSLPIIDSDLAGGRAVPSLSDIAIASKVPDFTMSPLAVMTANGEFEFLPKQSSIQEDENKLRSIVGKHKNQVLLFAGATLSGDFIKSNLAYSTYSLAISIGEDMRNGIFPPRLLKTYLPSIEVSISSIEEIDTGGFLDKKVILSAEGIKFVMSIENEYMSLESVACNYAFPDLITLYDQGECIGISSGAVMVGMEAILTVFKRHKLWR